MTDAASAPATPIKPKGVSLLVADERTQKRKAAEKRFRMYGMAGIATGIFFLIVLLTSACISAFLF